MKTPIANPKSQIPNLGCLLLLLTPLALSACTSSGTDDENGLPINHWLGGGKIEKPVDRAGDLFDTSNPDKRRDAIAWFQARKYGKEEVYIKSYTLLATDPDPLVRAQAMRALGQTGRYQIADPLIRGMKDDNVLVRRDAATAAENVNNPNLIDPLIERLSTDVDSQVRAHAVFALRKYNDPRVLRACAAALNDTEASVVWYAYQNLTAATGQGHIPMDAKPWTDYLNQKYPVKT